MGRKILLVANLGSPRSPSPRDVGIYLREFLMDPDVLDIPWLLRFFLVYLVIVPFRKYRSAEAYHKIWTSEGSPLVSTTRKFAEKLAEKLRGSYEVHWAMRYSEPGIARVIQTQLHDLKDGDEVFFVPLYPQYAASSTETALTAFKKAMRGLTQRGVRSFYLQDFFDQKPFIQTVAAQIADCQKTFAPDYFLFSYHGLPERHLTKLPGGEACNFGSCCELKTFENRYCYRAQAFRTTQLLAFQLGLTPAQYGISFQSRLGRTPWIQPFTDIRLQELAAQGVSKIAVVCPSFVTDCLETLEEIQIAARENFIKAGGKELVLISCPNHSDMWVNSFCEIVKSAHWRCSKGD